MQLLASLAAPAPEVSVPAAGPKPWPVLRWVPAQREPDREWHRGSTLPGESPSPPQPPTWCTSYAGPTLATEQVCASAAADSWGHQIIAAARLPPPPPTLFLSLGWLGQALPGSPCLSPVSRARSEAVVWPRAFRQPLHLLAGCAASGTARGLWGLAPSCLTNPQAQQFSEGGPVA